MFKSIEYKLITYLIVLILAVTCATYYYTQQQYMYFILAVLVIAFSMRKLYMHYNRFNANILFLLNALENGDYSFHFAETKMSKREMELNKMMNRIKEILSRARKEIIENERFLSTIIESVSVGIIILDKNNMIRVVNKASNELLGMPVLTHINQLSKLDDSFPQLFANLHDGEKEQIKVQNERDEIQINISVSQIQLKDNPMRIITLSNIGNELDAREMESWVKLIRVMTHEIMNSIAPITSLTHTLLYAYQNREDTDAEVLQSNTVDALQTINTTTKVLASFVDSYQQFSGLPKPQKSEFYLLPLLKEVLYLESIQMKNKHIKTSLKCDPSIKLDADEKQVIQILINLIKNATEAMPLGIKSEIKIEVEESNKQLYIRVSNNGNPVPADVAPHIFIPFFTTKDTGTGIGLSVSRYIMRLHGGNLKYHSNNEWTVFSMVFME